MFEGGAHRDEDNRPVVGAGQLALKGEREDGERGLLRLQREAVASLEGLVVDTYINM